jgi:hypothetical protein
MMLTFRASGGLPVTLKYPISRTEIILKGVKPGVVDNMSALWRLWVNQKWEPKLVWAAVCELYLEYVLFRKKSFPKKELYSTCYHYRWKVWRERPLTKADFLAYCAKNLQDSLSSVPMTESKHNRQFGILATKALILG